MLSVWALQTLYVPSVKFDTPLQDTLQFEQPLPFGYCVVPHPHVPAAPVLAVQAFQLAFNVVFPHVLYV